MFDVAPTELLLVAVVALVVIGPKDLPKAMRVVGNWVGRAKAMARHFRSGMDAMMRESELEEMEKKWKEENERIMREFPRAEDFSLTGPESPMFLPPADDDPQLPLLPAGPPPPSSDRAPERTEESPPAAPDGEKPPLP
jgi:sec-independent protein translocase protein TatB